MVLYIRRVHPDAVLPKRANPTDAGLDLSAIEEATIEPMGRCLIDTGLQVLIPSGHYLRIAPRSGLAVKNGIHIGAGVVDEGYTGNVRVLVCNISDTVFSVTKGMRIAQAILEKCSLDAVEEVDELPETDRGANGFGSTGKN